MLKRYVKKPVVIEAEVYRRGLEDGFEKDVEKCPALCQDSCGSCPNYKPFIRTLEGKHYISPGDYIITGIRGERYPCKPGIFAETYEEVEEQEDILGLTD